MSCTSAYRSALSFAVPPCPVGAPGLAIVGVFVPRYETDSTFASTSLQRNETAIAFASDERPFLGHFDPAKVLVVSMERAAWLAKVLVVSMGRAAWRAKVLVVSMGRAVWRGKVLAVSMGCAAWRAKVLVVSKLPPHRVLCAKKFALRGLEWVCARNSSPCKPKTGGKCFFRRAGRVFSRESHWKPYAGRVFSRMSH